MHRLLTIEQKVEAELLVRGILELDEIQRKLLYSTSWMDERIFSLAESRTRWAITTGIKRVLLDHKPLKREVL